jgi:hypothetical protein
MNEDEGIPPTPSDPPPPAPPAAPAGPPPGAPPGGGAERPGNDWERRTEVGFLDSLIGTIKGFMFAPGETFEKTRESGDLGSPLLFAILIAFVMSIVGQIWGMFFGASLLSMLPAEAREAAGMFLMTSGFGFFASIILVPIITVIGIFLYSAILHLMLLLVGGLGESTSGFEGSIRVVSYAQVATLAQVVPIIGGMIAFFWGLFLGVVGVTRMHRTSDGKAVAAVILPMILCCACIMAAIMFGGLAAFMGASN